MLGIHGSFLDPSPRPNEDPNNDTERSSSTISVQRTVISTLVSHPVISPTKTGRSSVWCNCVAWITTYKETQHKQIER